MTEKSLVAFITGQVPILWGAPNAAEFLPPHSYIDLTHYGSPGDLAAYLRHLELHPDEYAAYHAWRTRSIWSYGVAFR